jgi:hypothetical protein
VLLEWQPGDALAVSYRVEYRAGDGPWIEFDQALPNVTRATLTLSFGVTYSFRVRAIGSNSVSPYSNERTLMPRARRRAA